MGSGSVWIHRPVVWQRATFIEVLPCGFKLTHHLIMSTVAGLPRRDVGTDEMAEKTLCARWNVRLTDLDPSILTSSRKVTAMQVQITTEAIQRAVAEYFSLSVAELKGRNSTRAVAVPRQVAMYLAKQMTASSLQMIGQEFGGKHHTTVMHSVARIHQRRRADKDLNHAVVTLLETLRPSGS
jgi:chromosomal replication initiation ATPase DnaA